MADPTHATSLGAGSPGPIVPDAPRKAEPDDALSKTDADREESSRRAADRDRRRAALNLMEDAVSARRAERRENDERRGIEEQLRIADRRKDEFLATLAHELRGPMAPVRNSLNILRHGDPDAPTRVRLLAMMDKQMSHMVRLVDDLLEVSRITRGRVELRREAVAVASVLRRAVEASAVLIEECGQTLEVSLPDEPLILDADPVRIAQVVTNLLNNAAKYSARGGRIWLSAVLAEENVVISVRDTGSGIPPNMLPKIFDLFTQLDRTYDRSRGGLGIGLTLARSLVEMHGGRISAESEGADRGSVFTVVLPLSEATSPTAPSSDTELAGSHSSALTEDKRVRRVLVVDDDTECTETLGLLLEMLGHRVAVANYGAVALDVVRTFLPDIVLLDIGMPGMDGYEVARRVRQLPEGRSVTLVALTGWGQREDRERSREVGFDEHLVKPIAIETLEAVLSGSTKTAAVTTG